MFEEKREAVMAIEAAVLPFMPKDSTFLPDLPPPLLRALVRGSGHRRLVPRRRHHFHSERGGIALQTPHESREVGDELNHVPSRVHAIEQIHQLQRYRCRQPKIGFHEIFVFDVEERRVNNVAGSGDPKHAVRANDIRM
jgi:hypothetical protein